jgi:hypothetical protein
MRRTRSAVASYSSEESADGEASRHEQRLEQPTPGTPGKSRKKIGQRKKVCDPVVGEV